MFRSPVRRSSPTPRPPACTVPILFLLLFVQGCGGGGGNDDPMVPSTGSLEGRVQNADGGGVAGAGVTLSRSGEANRTATTPAAGTFTFGNLAPGSWAVQTQPPSGWTLAEGEPAQRSVNVQAGQTASVTIQLRPMTPTSGAITGSVTHAQAGVLGVTVRINGPGGEAREVVTPAAGGFGFQDLPPGAWTLAVEPPAYFRLPAGTADPRPVQVTAGATTTAAVVLEPTSAPRTEGVQLLDLSFAPAQVTISPGSTVRWTNAGPMVHTITPDGHSAWQERGMNNSGETFEVVFNNPGDHPYFCVPHRASGMTGMIRVVP